MSNFPFETFPLTKRIGIVNPVANLDARYGPWPTYNDALTAFSFLVRERGLTVAVSGVGGIVEYWYKNGTTDGDLVLKSAATNIYQDLTGNWQSTYSIVSSLSASWEESADILPTVTNYLSTNNVLISALTITNTFSGINSLTINGNISGNNLRTSFNQGSATGEWSFAVNRGRAFGNFSHAEGFGTRARGEASHAAGFYTDAVHNRTWIWKGTSSTTSLSTTRQDQFMVNADGGVALFGRVGIGTDSVANALTIVGNISATGLIYGNYPIQILASNETNLNTDSFTTFVKLITAPNAFTFTNFTSGKTITLYLCAEHSNFSRHYFPQTTYISEAGEGNTVYTFQNYITKVTLQNIGTQFIGTTDIIPINIEQVIPVAPIGASIILEDRLGYLKQEDGSYILL